MNRYRARRIGRPVTPMSWAWVARRTTQKWLRSERPTGLAVLPCTACQAGVEIASSKSAGGALSFLSTPSPDLPRQIW
jgi:hypothetical protein